MSRVTFLESFWLALEPHEMGLLGRFIPGCPGDQ